MNISTTNDKAVTPMAKDKTKYSCSYCGDRFVKMYDHMSHVMKMHDKGFREREDRLRRPISCWSCGTVDVYPSGEDNWFYCTCGWVLPRNWANGQLAADEPEKSNEAP
jgi:5-methylcytosine-specific restriction endonuclease McrA